MGYRRSLGADAESVALQTQVDKIDANTVEIIDRLKAEKRARKIATWVTIAGAVFAAVRLGIVTIPKFFRRGAREVGQLGEAALSPAVKNPARRRRRAPRRRRRR